MDSTIEVDIGYTFYSYYYAVRFTKVIKNSETKLLYFNTGYSITLVDYI